MNAKNHDPEQWMAQINYNRMHSSQNALQERQQTKSDGVL
jgi:hypothetical protein